MKSSTLKPASFLASLMLFTALTAVPALASQAQQPQPSRPGNHRLAEEYERQRLRDENDYIAPDGMLKAIEQARKMKYAAKAWPGAKPKLEGVKLKGDLNTNTWEWLGPGNIGGRIRAVAIHPTTPDIMWVGGVTGGIWKTTNGAASFYPVDEWLASLAITDIKLDATNPDVLYASTGEDVRGAGIFKSIDGGNTWARLPATSYETNYNVVRLSICPTNSQILLAACGNGIWRTTDGGTNWTQTFTNGTIANRGQVIFDPVDGSKAIAMGSGTNRALYSTDGGVTWTPATGLGTSGRVEFGYARSSPNILYASQNVNGGTLFASSDGGVTYSQRSVATNLLIQGDWDNVVWVDPTNPEVLIIGGVDLFRSTDAGTNFTKISSWGANQLAQIKDQFSSAHADHHILIAHPNFDGTNNAVIYNGNDGGLFGITNVYVVNETNSCWTNLNHHLGITQFYGGAGSPTTFTVQGGGQDNGHARGKAGEWTDRWHLFKGGDGGFCAVDPTDPNYFYGEYIYLEIGRSTDEGQTATDIFGGIGDAGIPPPWHDDPDLKPENPDVPAKANFIAPFILDPNNPNTMLAGGSNLWRSLNVKTTYVSNITWSICMTNPGNGTFISAIAVQQGNSDIAWVGFNNGDVYMTTNGTDDNPTWTRKDLGTPNLPNRKCQRLAIDATDPNIVYASFGGFNTNNLYRSADGGVTWSNIATALPVAPVNTIVIAPWNHNYLYVGTEVGIFASEDAGATWSAANEGPANVRTDELFWLRNYLHAATYGRGMFRIALGPPTVVVTPSPLTSFSGANPAFTASAIGSPTLSLQWQRNGSNITGATGTTLTLTNVQTTNSGLYTVVVSNGQGSASATATLTVLDSPPYRTQTLATGPVAYWRLNELSGTTAYDSVASYHGTKLGSLVLGTNGVGAPTFPGFESGNPAFQFNGSDTSVSVPALNLDTNAVTITAWIKRSGSQASWSGLFFCRAGTTASGFHFGTGNELRYTWNGSGSTYNYNSGLVPPDGQWTFVALVIEPARARIFMATNSTLYSATNTVANAMQDFSGTSYLGYDPNSSSRRFNGTMDEVAIFNQALTPSQLSDLLSSAMTLLPAVTLTAPTDGSSFTALSNITLTASVTTNGHSIEKLRFYNSATLLTEDTTPPYQYDWSGMTAGAYTLLAQVVYDGGSVLSSLPANITITNLPPTPMDDVTNTVENTPVTIAVLANDTDPYNLPLTIQSVTQGSFGSVAIAGTNVIYTPTNYNYGVDTFTYTVNDGYGATATATVTVTVPFLNHAPAFTNATLSRADGTVGAAYAATLAGTATDVDPGDTHTYSKVSGPAWLTVAASGALSGTPLPDNAGSNTFTVRVTDASAATGDAQLAIFVGVPATVLSSNLVAYLPFDSDYLDYSGLQNHPGQSNANLRATGYLGANAYVLTNGGYLSFGLDPDFHFANTTAGNSNSFSISFWAKIPPGTFSGAPPYIANKDWAADGNTGWALAAGLNSGGNGYFQMNFKEVSANLREYDSTSTALTNGNWHHYLVVFQRTATRTCFTYVDGALADSRTMFASATAIDSAGLPLNLGQDGTGTGTRGTWTNALMDDFGFWRRAVTATEVTAIYSAGTNGYSLAYAQAAPIITNQPSDTAVLVEGTLNLSVGVISATAPAYQWRTNGIALAGATNATYTKAGVTTADFASYDAVITNLYGSTTSRLAAVTSVNQPPVPGAFTLGTVMNQSATVGLGKILAHCTDPENDTLSITGVSATSTNGGTVTLTSSNLTYTPVTSYVGADSFTYTLDDSHGGIATGTVSVAVGSGQSFNLISAGVLMNGDSRLTYSGIPYQDYALEWTHSLSTPITWLPLRTNAASSIGLLIFTNTPSGGNDFYRTRSVP
jgi:hypothetical protein